jgi:ParB-like nuclease domain
MRDCLKLNLGSFCHLMMNDRHANQAGMFPLLKDAEFDDLVEDIRKHGLREPIILLQQKVIDGRNRERACIKAGVEPRYRSMELDQKASATGSLNRHDLREKHMYDCLKLNLGSFCHLTMNDWADPAREPGRNVPALERRGV